MGVGHEISDYKTVSVALTLSLFMTLICSKCVPKTQILHFFYVVTYCIVHNCFVLLFEMKLHTGQTNVKYLKKLEILKRIETQIRLDVLNITIIDPQISVSICKTYLIFLHIFDIRMSPR